MTFGLIFFQVLDDRGLPDIVFLAQLDHALPILVSFPDHAVTWGAQRFTQSSFFFSHRIQPALDAGFLAICLDLLQKRCPKLL